MASEELTEPGAGIPVGQIAQTVFAPSTTDQIPTFYCVWMLIYIAVHIVWDARSERTPSFNVVRLAQRHHLIYSGATFASSLLIVLGVLTNSVRELISDTALPLLIAGGSGILSSISAAAPYRLRHDEIEPRGYEG